MSHSVFVNVERVTHDMGVRRTLLHSRMALGLSPPQAHNYRVSSFEGRGYLAAIYFYFQRPSTRERSTGEVPPRLIMAEYWVCTMYGLPTRALESHVPVPSYCTSYLLVTLSPRLLCKPSTHPRTPHSASHAQRYLSIVIVLQVDMSLPSWLLRWLLFSVHNSPRDPCRSLGPADAHHPTMQPWALIRDLVRICSLSGLAGLLGASL